MKRKEKWVINPDSEDGYEHHMCPACKTDAIFDYVYMDDYDEDFDEEWQYIGQIENGISEHLTKYCPECGECMIT